MKAKHILYSILLTLPLLFSCQEDSTEQPELFFKSEYDHAIEEHIHHVAE